MSSSLSGTLARGIVDGARQVCIFGEEYAEYADVYTICEISAHADQSELLAWLEHTGNPDKTIPGTHSVDC